MAASYTSFGNYLLLKQLSQDGLGSLWRAGEMERLGFKRIVWLRRFDQAGLDRTALAAEANLVNQLAQTFRATNVARNVACGSEGGVPFLAWEYVPAQPLDQLLQRVTQEQFPVAIDNALLIAEKLAGALSSALAVEVRGEPLAHGFLVPQLVLIGNDGEAVVAGFGLSRGLLANLDRVAVQEMAAPYLAPEVLATASPSRRGDVYSLGAILYHLLCGHPLPADPAARPAALASARLAGEEGPLPADVLAILQKSLAGRPEDRYGSASDFKRELEKLLYGGAYSPTTFNLALFMDRLYRHEIEEEDRELQREKGLDVTPYYRPPRSATGESAAAEAPPAQPTSRTGLYAALGGVVVLLGVILYLLVGRTPPQATVDQAALKAMVQEELAKYAKREKELADQLAQEKQHNEEIQRQIEQQQKAAAAGKRQLSPEEQAKIDQQKRDLEARLAEQKRKEDELAQVRQKQAEAQAAAQAAAQAPVRTTAPRGGQPAAVPTSAPPPPTTAPVVAAVQPTAAAPTTEATSAPPAAQPGQPSAQTAPGAGTAVHEGDMVDQTQVDVPPQKLITADVVLPRAVQQARSAASGVVILQALVDERGVVDQVRVMRGFPVEKLGVDEACIDAVKRYRYKPAMKDGVPVKTWTTVTFRVDLTRSR